MPRENRGGERGMNEASRPQPRGNQDGGRGGGRGGNGGRGGEGGSRSREGRSRGERQGRSSLRPPRDFTFISGWVKYTMFFFNFLFWLMGGLLVAVGTYAIIDNWKSGDGLRLENLFDVIFNLGFLMVIIGGVIFIVSFAGCIGALRENVCLLKFYSLCLLIFFLAEMALAGLGLIFPYKFSEFFEGYMSDELIKNYRDDLDFQNLIDSVQQHFECCGISRNGYKDWDKNEYFSCPKNKTENPSVERCGVPFSCCLPSNEDLVNFMCGFQVQDQALSEVVGKIYTKGCVDTIKGWVEANLLTVGGVALGVAALQLLVIWLARTLETQIDDQKSLWQYQ